MSRPRRWLELRVRGPSGEDDDRLLSEGLLALGGRAVEERDGWYVTHLEEPEDPEAFLDRAEAELRELSGLPSLEVQSRWQAHEDWAESWKRGLDTRHITRRLVVTPSWTPYHGRDGEVVLVLDPGMAFGTAEHGTTRGCLRLLDSVAAPGQRLLDVGAGSGILSIAGALLGAREVVAVEGDPLACEAMAENVDRNRVGDRVEVVEAWADAEELARWHPRDGVLSNIEWQLLRPLVPGLRRAVAPGGWLLLSGITVAEVEDVRSLATSLDLTVRGVDEDGMWRSLLLDPREG